MIPKRAGAGDLGNAGGGVVVGSQGLNKELARPSKRNSFRRWRPSPAEPPNKRHGAVRAGVAALALAMALGWAVGAKPESPVAAILAKMAAEQDPDSNPFLNDQRAARLRLAAEKEKDPVEKLIRRSELAVELLLAGQSKASLAEIHAIQEKARAWGAPEDAPVMKSLRELTALASLRLGEQENCIARHSADSCLLPIRNGGVHTRTRGSRQAITEYLGLLEMEPDNLSYRWLLNLAYMTLGDYPDKVPPDYLIPPSTFESTGKIPRFREVAAAAGIDADGHAGGVVTEDFDGDGNLDVMVSSWALEDQLLYFRNKGDGTFSDWTVKANLLGQTGGLNLVHADYNNDGWPDVLILRGGWLGFMRNGLGNQPNTLLRNRGDGTFDDATLESGTLCFHPTQTAAWGDYNLDGFLDLFIGNETSGEDSHATQLYRNNGDGTFTDVAAEVGLAQHGLVKAVVWGDYDNDGRPDLYLSRFGETNLLFHNDGPVGGSWRFSDRTKLAGVSEPRLSLPAWFWDYDNDGWEDILAASFLSYAGDTLDIIVADYLGRRQTETSRLYRNNGDGTFSDATRSVHLEAALTAMGTNFGDLDNDGFLDFYVGTGQPQMSTLVPNRMFRNAGGRVFQDVTSAGGFGHVQKGHGVSFADLDNDGDQDIYAALGGAYSGDRYRNALFRNPGNSNHWVAFRLRGVTANRLGLGARIKVTVLTPGGQRTIHRTVNSGGSFGSSSLRVHIGLGDASRIQSVDVRWPVANAEPQIFTQVPMDRVIQVVQGSDTLRTLSLTTFNLASSPTHARHPK